MSMTKLDLPPVVEDGDEGGQESGVLSLGRGGAEQGSNNGGGSSASDDLTAVGRERHLRKISSAKPHAQEEQQRT
jgi:hypothetical protein